MRVKLRIYLYMMNDLYRILILCFLLSGSSSGQSMYEDSIDSEYEYNEEIA